MNNIIKDLKLLIQRGNVIDLMIAVVFGNALASILRSIIDDIGFPIFRILIKNKKIEDLEYNINGVNIKYGQLINNFIVFIMTTFVLLYFFIKPLNKYIS